MSPLYGSGMTAGRLIMWPKGRRRRIHPFLGYKPNVRRDEVIEAICKRVMKVTPSGSNTSNDSQKGEAAKVWAESSDTHPYDIKGDFVNRHHHCPLLHHLHLSKLQLYFFPTGLPSIHLLFPPPCLGLSCILVPSSSNGLRVVWDRSEIPTE